MRHYLTTAACIATLAAFILVPGRGDAQQAPASAAPAVVEQLGLTDIERRGDHILGRLPDGTRVEVEIDRRGNIEEIEAERGSAFPARAVEALVPAIVRNHPSYPGDASFRKVEFDDDDRIEIYGQWADGRRFEAEFATGGRLIELKIRD